MGQLLKYYSMFHTIPTQNSKIHIINGFYTKVSLPTNQKWITQLFFLFVRQSAETLCLAVAGAFRK